MVVLLHDLVMAIDMVLRVISLVEKYWPQIREFLVRYVIFPSPLPWRMGLRYSLIIIIICYGRGDIFVFLIYQEYMG